MILATFGVKKENKKKFKTKLKMPLVYSNCHKSEVLKKVIETKTIRKIRQIVWYEKVNKNW